MHHKGVVTEIKGAFQTKRRKKRPSQGTTTNGIYQPKPKGRFVWSPSLNEHFLFGIFLNGIKHAQAKKMHESLCVETFDKVNLQSVRGHLRKLQLFVTRQKLERIKERRRELQQIAQIDKAELLAHSAVVSSAIELQIKFQNELSQIIAIQREALTALRNSTALMWHQLTGQGNESQPQSSYLHSWPQDPCVADQPGTPTSQVKINAQMPFLSHKILHSENSNNHPSFHKRKRGDSLDLAELEKHELDVFGYKDHNGKASCYDSAQHRSLASHTAPCSLDANPDFLARMWQMSERNIIRQIENERMLLRMDNHNGVSHNQPKCDQEGNCTQHWELNFSNFADKAFQDDFKDAVKSDDPAFVSSTFDLARKNSVFHLNQSSFITVDTLAELVPWRRSFARAVSADNSLSPKEQEETSAPEATKQDQPFQHQIAPSPTLTKIALSETTVDELPRTDSTGFFEEYFLHTSPSKICGVSFDQELRYNDFAEIFEPGLSSPQKIMTNNCASASCSESNCRHDDCSPIFSIDELMNFENKRKLSVDVTAVFL